MERGGSMIPVFVDDPNTWTKIEVPPEIVRICKDFTLIDPYNDDNTVSEKLRLIDCYWYNMGYYGGVPPIFPLFE